MHPADTFVNHPAFTNDAADAASLCDAVNAMTIFCSARNLETRSRFVGVVASMPTMHNGHAHVSVWVRGAVTMACDLEALRDAGEPRQMDTLSFALPTHAGEALANSFVGLPGSFLRPIVGKANRRSCTRVIGTLLELGRAPSNEVRVILRAGEHYHHRDLDDVGAVGASERAECMTLAEVRALLAHVGDDSADDLVDTLLNKVEAALAGGTI